MLSGRVLIVHLLDGTKETLYLYENLQNNCAYLMIHRL